MGDDERGASVLLGAWVTDPADETALREYGRATLEFAPGGQLTYIAHGDERDRISLLNYRVEGDCVVMESGPSVAPESRARFRVTRGGALVLSYGDRTARYVRRPDPHDAPSAATERRWWQRIFEGR